MKQLPYHLLGSILSVLTLSGCLSPMTLNRAVMAYDDAVVSADAKQLLVNIARAQHHLPIHFTRVSNIAATFDFSANAGATPALTGDAGGRLLPLFGGSMSENPTFSIVPIEGEEFMRRMLTPFHQSKLTLLLRQHFDVDLMLRMMAQEVRLLHTEPLDTTTSSDQQATGHRYHRHRYANEHVVTDSIERPPLPGIENVHNIELTEEQQYRIRLRQQRHRYQATYRNSPSDQAGYEMFRRIVLHLSAIQDQKNLYAEPLTLERSWTIPGSAVSGESFQSLEKDFAVRYNRQDDTYTLSKKVLGPVLITNYDPDILCCEERADMRDLISPWIENDVAFDIRPGYPGGEWPIRGTFRLRSFYTILNFLSHALGEEPEYHVDKDPRTPPIFRDENPVHTLELIISDTSLPKNMLTARSQGKYYAVDTIGPNAHWNMNAFQLLYILFRMTVTDATPIGVPSITIAK
ncbi:MAG TPA: hypothetical protein DEO56_09355 [Nitrosomonas nitrosa]|jgi:hypothetical protein|nr:hypothetical protein [Nitrosomonas nitrosa]HNP50323.1 hypothetical protein [Nitrosomonas nitrosa]